jgi:hypothetical protein
MIIHGTEGLLVLQLEVHTLKNLREGDDFAALDFLEGRKHTSRLHYNFLQATHRPFVR